MQKRFLRRATPPLWGALIGSALLGVPEANADPPLPVIPATIFRVTDYGARGDGTTLNTAALQDTVNACLQSGGGVVEVPAGTFLTGPLTLGSNLDLQLDAGATLLLSDDTSAYPVSGSRFQDAFSAKNCHDLAITGSGTIDGQGAVWWANYASNTPLHRPYLIAITGCTRLLVQGVTLKHSPMFHLVPDTCQDVTIQGLSVSAPSDSPNTDGLDPSGWDYLIQNCTFDVGDDCIALKPTHLIKADQPSCLNFTIQNCTFLHGHGLSIGGETPGGLNGMTVRNCTFNGTVAGIRMKASRGNGGLVQNVSYDGLTMTGVGTPIQITSYYPSIPSNLAADPAQPVTGTTPIWRNIAIRNVTATGASTDAQIIGLPEMPVSNVTLTNVSLAGKNGVTVAHGRVIQFCSVGYTNTSGAATTLIDAQVTTVSPATASGGVTLQGWTGTPQPLTFTLTPTGGTPGIALAQTLTPGADGSFSLPGIPAGTYTLGVKGSRWLQKDAAVTVTTAGATVPPLTLPGGDINGDGVVDFSDFFILRGSFNAAGANLPADINGDGTVDFSDFFILRNNFNAAGDP